MGPTNRLISLSILNIVCISIAYSQSCMKTSRVIPQPLLNTRLVEKVTTSITTYSELNCIHRCYQVEGCDSINTKVNSEDSTICEIFAHEGSPKQKKFVASDGWKYYDFKLASVCDADGNVLCPDSKICVDDPSQYQGYRCIETSNIAYLQKTHQSSNYASVYLSGNAVDGNRNGDTVAGNSCSHTGDGKAPHWWRVQFGKEAKVRSVQITNRGDCCSERLGKFDILVGSSEANNGKTNSVCQSHLSMTQPGTKLFSCQKVVVGKFLYIHSHLTSALTLCEVEVFGILMSPTDKC